jgi:hypothetical protein
MRRFLSIAIVLLCVCCEVQPTEQDFPVMETLAPDNVNESGATFHAKLYRKGVFETSSYGFIWDTIEPTLEKAFKIEVGKSVGGTSFTARIDHGLVAGMTYYIKAYAVYDERIVYGGTVQLKSNGSSNSPWELEATNIPLDVSYNCRGISDQENGYLLFDDNNFYIFDPENRSFTKGVAMPSPEQRRVAATTTGKYPYIFAHDNESNDIYYYDGGWKFQTHAPISVDNTYYGFQYDDRIYLLSLEHIMAYIPSENQSYLLPEAPYSFSSVRSVGGTSIDNKGYLIASNKKLLEFDTDNYDWTELSDFPGTVQQNTVAFAENGKVYVGLSFDEYQMDNNLWSYDLSNDKWTSMERFPANLNAYSRQFFFFVKGKLYFGGLLSTGFSVWSFDPTKAEN